MIAAAGVIVASLAALTGPIADVSLDGVVVVVDPDRAGAESRGESGTLELRVFTSDGELHVLGIPVEAGRFSARVPEDSRVAVGGLVLGDRWADPVPRDFRAVPIDGVLDVRARWGDSMVVRVVDAESGRELRDVSLSLVQLFDHPSLGLANAYVAPDFPGAVVAWRADSPLRVSSFSDVAAPHRRFALLVRVPGFSRELVHVSGQPGERVVTLVSVAELEVAIENDRGESGAAHPGSRHTWLVHPRTRPLLQPVLTLRRRDARGVTTVVERRIPVPDAKESFPLLEPGEYEIDVAIGPESERPIVLAAATLALDRGRGTEARLALADPPATAIKSGEVVVPGAWLGAAVHVEVEPRDVPGLVRGRGVRVVNSGSARREGAADVWSFETTRLLPGRYAVIVAPLGVEREVDVVPGDYTPIRIVLGEPSRVRLRVSAADTGEPIAAAGVACALPAADPDWRPASAVAGEPGSFTFTCLAGDVLVAIEDDAYAGRVTLAKLLPGDVDRAISLPRASGFVLAVDSGVLPVGPIRDALVVRALDGGEPAALCSAERVGGTERLRCVLARPGRYLVTLRAMAPYRDVEPFEIAVAAGEFAVRPLVLATGD